MWKIKSIPWNGPSRFQNKWRGSWSLTPCPIGYLHAYFCGFLFLFLFFLSWWPINCILFLELLSNWCSWTLIRFIYFTFIGTHLCQAVVNSKCFGALFKKKKKGSGAHYPLLCTCFYCCSKNIFLYRSKEYHSLSLILFGMSCSRIYSA